MSHDLRHYYLPALKPASSGSVLDFGSGHGRVISFLRGEGFRNVHGFERNEKLRAELAPEVLANTTFGTDWPAFLAKGMIWDAVVLKDVLYYFDDAAATDFLRKLRTHLSKDGILAVEVFNGATLTGPYVMYKDRGIQRVFTEQSLRSLLNEAGYTVESVRGMKPALTGLRSAVYFLLSAFWKWNLRVIFWSERGWDAENPSILDKKIFAVAKAGGGHA